MSGGILGGPAPGTDKGYYIVPHYVAGVIDARGHWYDPNRVNYPRWADLPYCQQDAEARGATHFWCGPAAACHRGHSAPLTTRGGLCTACKREDNADQAALAGARQWAGSKVLDMPPGGGSPAQRWQARQHAALHGLPVPEWAQKRSERGRPKERADSAGLTPAVGQALARMLERKRCAAKGLPVPEWAQLRPRGSQKPGVSYTPLAVAEAKRRLAERKRCEAKGLPVPEWAQLRRAAGQPAYEPDLSDIA